MSKRKNLPWSLLIFGFPGGSVVKNLSANAGKTRDIGLIPGLGKTPGGGHGNPLPFLPRESHEQRSLAGYSPSGRKELNVTEHTLSTTFKALPISISEF